MKILTTGALALVFAAAAFAGDATPGAQPQSQSQSQPQSQPKPRQTPATDMDRLLRELRDLTSGQDRQGEHVVGEMYCQGLPVFPSLSLRRARARAGPSEHHAQDMGGPVTAVAERELVSSVDALLISPRLPLVSQRPDPRKPCHGINPDGSGGAKSRGR